MASVRFISIEEIIELHSELMQRFGGADGVRDLGLLESAAAQASARFGENFLHTDLAAMAAAYLFHICKNHPFVDGNKRTAALTADVFVTLNGGELQFSADQLAELTESVADGSLSKDRLTEMVRTSILHEH
jgi:death on curing protein